MSFTETFGLRTAESRAAAAEVLRRVRTEGIEIVRLSFADQHGILRGKAVVAADLARALDDGVTVTTSLFAKDTSHKTVFDIWHAGGGLGLREMEGAADALILPDPATFRILPWAPRTGWLLCEPYFASGKPVPFGTRRIMRTALARLADAGYDYVAGLEVEFHLFRLKDPRLAPDDSGQPGRAPEVELLTQGYQYLTEQRFDAVAPALDILRQDLTEIGLPLRSLEVEFGPSQVELTFFPRAGIDAADDMVLLRSAVKQIARRHGFHATFMCRPRLPNIMSSGWHLHQSLRDRKTGANAFIPRNETEALAPLGMAFMAGLLAHGRGGALFAAPSINGYKRYRANSLAPDRLIWGKDSRGAMIRVLGAPGDEASRVENRAGEPGANPYLYMAAQIFAGLDGMTRKLDPGPTADAPYDAKVPLLPKSLGEAMAALKADERLVADFGEAFVAYYLHIKEAEIARYDAEVSDWEQREYFDLF
jgi:glutamine synthetase